jgi:DNA-binding IclR family transcriptional regulator
MSEPYRPVGPQTVTARIAAIVLAVAARPHPSMTEVARTLGLPVSTTHRLLSGLVAGRLVVRTTQGRYQLDPTALPTWSGSAALRAHIRTAVVDLADITGLQVRFGVWHEHGVSCLGWSGGHGRQEALTSGEVLPAHATAAGKALLAFAPETEVHRILARRLPAYTSRTITTCEALLEALATVRLRGVAVAHGERRADEWAAAAPVFGPTGVIAALEMAGTGFSPNVKGQTPALLYAARALGRRLADQPALLPPGTGTYPLRWPVDPASSAPADDTGAMTSGRTTVPPAGQDSARKGSRARPAASLPRTRPPAARVDRQSRPQRKEPTWET